MKARHSEEEDQPKDKMAQHQRQKYVCYQVADQTVGQIVMVGPKTCAEMNELPFGFRRPVHKGFC